ncbi:hypothetical protein LXL04_005595 [Taraxacum kok-saghyz]
MDKIKNSSIYIPVDAGDRRWEGDAGDGRETPEVAGDAGGCRRWETPEVAGDGGSIPPLWRRRAVCAIRARAGRVSRERSGLRYKIEDSSEGRTESDLQFTSFKRSDHGPSPWSESESSVCGKSNTPLYNYAAKIIIFSLLVALDSPASSANTRYLGKHQSSIRFDSSSLIDRSITQTWG